MTVICSLSPLLCYTIQIQQKMTLLLQGGKKAVWASSFLPRESTCQGQAALQPSMEPQQQFNGQGEGSYNSGTRQSSTKALPRIQLTDSRNCSSRYANFEWTSHPDNIHRPVRIVGSYSASCWAPLSKRARPANSCTCANSNPSDQTDVPHMRESRIATAQGKGIGRSVVLRP